MQNERRFVYRIEPYLQLGILLEDDQFCYWKSTNFPNLDERFARKWDYSRDSYILYSPFHTKPNLKENQRMEWIDPTIQNTDFTISENQIRILKEQIYIISKHYPTKKKLF